VKNFNIFFAFTIFPIVLLLMAM